LRRKNKKILIIEQNIGKQLNQHNYVQLNSN
jgi:hypothetical protein